MKKIDRRRHYHLLLDVETTGSFETPLIYDLGLAIVDKQGKIYEERSFVIEEIYTNRDLMLSAYFYSKMPLYREGLKTGKFIMVKWLQAIEEMNKLANLYKTKTVAAYNLAFDSKAMTKTHRRLGYQGKILNRPMKTLCIWGMACQTIFSQKTYSKVATEQGWVSNAGNYRTNAEVAYKYITGNYNFEEEHTGLEDVRVEAKIMADCYRQNKKMSKGIIQHPWRIPNKGR